MIYGIGTDIVKIDRIIKVYQNYGDKVINKVLHPSEIIASHKLSSNLLASNLAKKWAAKEAFVKAIGIGLREPFYMSNMYIENDELGKPCMRFSNSIMSILDKLSIKKIHLSISDEINYAVAMVIVEC